MTTTTAPPLILTFEDDPFETILGPGPVWAVRRLAEGIHGLAHDVDNPSAAAAARATQALNDVAARGVDGSTCDLCPNSVGFLLDEPDEDIWPPSRTCAFEVWQTTVVAVGDEETLTVCDQHQPDEITAALT